MKTSINTWFKQNMPDTYEFFKNFFLAMNNKTEGHSLKKWLAVGFFWLVAECVFRYTDDKNVEGVLIILTSMITALVITNAVQVTQTAKKDKKDLPPSDIPPLDNPPTNG